MSSERGSEVGSRGFTIFMGLTWTLANLDPTRNAVIAVKKHRHLQPKLHSQDFP